ncbi:alpha/beta-hydrolase [Rozella allomycis CSF55]|nr:alpha/beta-hydrolase [Rozella allomycis CSF55]
MISKFELEENGVYSKDSAIYMEKLKPTLLDAYIPYLPKEQLVNRDNVIIIDDKLEPKQVRGVVLKKPGELTISFRGTSSTDDIKSDLKVLPAAYEQTDSKVHAGFYNMHKEYIDQVTESVAKLMAQEPGSIKKITLTGHSLGGTLAVLAALHIKSIPNMPRVKIVTFGQPPIGDKAFANHVNHEFPGDQYLRVKQKGDPLNANVKLFGNGVTGKRRIKLVQAGKKVYVEGFGHSFQKHIKNDREQFVNSG